MATWTASYSSSTDQGAQPLMGGAGVLQGVGGTVMYVLDCAENVSGSTAVEALRDFGVAATSAWRIVAHTVSVALTPRATSRDAERDFKLAFAQCHSGELWKVLQKLRAGTIDGTNMEDCFFGTIAELRNTVYGSLGMGENPNRPLEVWLMRNVGFGDTPQNNRYAAMLQRWLVAELRNREYRAGDVVRDTTTMAWVSGRATAERSVIRNNVCRVVQSRNGRTPPSSVDCEISGLTGPTRWTEHIRAHWGTDNIN